MAGSEQCARATQTREAGEVLPASGGRQALPHSHTELCVSPPHPQSGKTAAALRSSQDESERPRQHSVMQTATQPLTAKDFQCVRETHHEHEMDDSSNHGDAGKNYFGLWQFEDRHVENQITMGPCICRPRAQPGFQRQASPGWSVRSRAWVGTGACLCPSNFWERTD